MYSKEFQDSIKAVENARKENIDYERTSWKWNEIRIFK